MTNDFCICDHGGRSGNRQGHWRYSSGEKDVSIWRVATGGPKSDSLDGLIGRSGASSRPL